MMKLNKGITTACAITALMLALSACQKKVETVEKGPAEKAGQQIDQAAAQAGKEFNKAAEDASKEINQATAQAGKEINEAVGKAGIQLEKTGEKIQEMAQEIKK